MRAGEIVRESGKGRDKGRAGEIVGVWGREGEIAGERVGEGESESERWRERQMALESESAGERAK